MMIQLSFRGKELYALWKINTNAFPFPMWSPGVMMKKKNDHCPYLLWYEAFLSLPPLRVEQVFHSSE